MQIIKPLEGKKLSKMNIEIREYTDFDLDEITGLYQAVGWTNYTARAGLLREAYEHSLCVLGAYLGDRLIGILRAVGDGVSVVFIQDLLVLPEFQRQGAGTKLLRSVMDRYQTVYQIELLTDDTDKTASFYRSVGFVPAGEIGCLSFIRLQQ